VGNVDIALMAERPKLAAHVPAMKARLAVTLGITPEDVGVKATTNEGCDSVGGGRRDCGPCRRAAVCRAIVGNGRSLAAQVVERPERAQDDTSSPYAARA